MKKGLLSIVALLVLTTVASAAPRFGVIAQQNTGFGAFITDDMFNAQVTYSSNESSESGDDARGTIGVGANYKVALDSVTSLTAGVGYTTSDANSIETTVLSLNIGIERALSSNILLTAQTAAYEQTTITTGGVDADAADMFDTNSVGIAFLF